MQRKIKRDRVIDLWQTCFNEDPEFLQLYFRRVYNPRNLFAHTQQGNVIAMLHALPYTMQALGANWQCSYIAGVATHPDFRRKGLMQQLLTHALSQLHQQEIPLTALIPATPALQQYYQRCGYTTLSTTQPVAITPPESMPKGYYPLPLSLNRQYYLYHTLNSCRQATILHSHAQYQTICADIELFGGSIHTIADAARQPVAIAFVAQQDGNLVIKELLAADILAEQALLYDIAQRHNITTIHQNITLPVALPIEHPRSMLRIIHAKPLLQAWAMQNRHIVTTLQIIDPLIADNNRNWHIANGSISPAITLSPAWQLSIDEATQLIFGQGSYATEFNLTPITPYLNLMLD